MQQIHFYHVSAFNLPAQYFKDGFEASISKAKTSDIQSQGQSWFSPKPRLALQLRLVLISA